MANSLKTLLEGIAHWIPRGWYPRLVKREVIPIFYHAVSDGAMSHVRHLYPVVPVREFEETLLDLKKQHTFITYAQLHAHQLEGAPLPQNAVHLSFDDGFVECFTVVRPILRRLQVPCTFFLTIDWIDNSRLFYRHLVSLILERLGQLSSAAFDSFLVEWNRDMQPGFSNRAAFLDWLTRRRDAPDPRFEHIATRLQIDPQAFLRQRRPYLTTEQIRRLHADGFTIGAHGLTHRKLGFVPIEEVEEEIVESCRVVQRLTGQAIVPFSFPQSAANLSRAHLAKIRARHPWIGLLFDTKDLRRDEPFLVNRVWTERPLAGKPELASFSEVLLHAYRDAWVDDVTKHALRLRSMWKRSPS